MAASLTDVLLKTVDVHAPLREVALQSRHKPWVSLDISRLSREKRRAYHLSLRTGNACAVYNDLTQEQNLKLHRLLNRCVRFVHGHIPWQAPVTPYRLALGWLTEEDTYRPAYSILSRHHPGYLFDIFTFKKDVPSRRISLRILPEPGNL